MYSRLAVTDSHQTVKIWDPVASSEDVIFASRILNRKAKFVKQNIFRS
jgi:hypothetical protein